MDEGRWRLYGTPVSLRKVSRCAATNCGWRCRLNWNSPRPRACISNPHEFLLWVRPRVLLGQYGGKSSPVLLPVSLTYLHVKLADGERWTYQPSADHEIAWLALICGKLHTSGILLERELAVFEEGIRSIEMVALAAVELVIGSAAKHPYPLVTGHYSVHTPAETPLFRVRPISPPWSIRPSWRRYARVRVCASLEEKHPLKPAGAPKSKK